MEVIPKIIEDYIAQHSDEEPPLLYELNRETNQKCLQPHMISGHHQGRLLSLLSRLIRPKYILDIGTFTGYSSLCMAEGLSKDGFLHTIDIDEELRDIQQRYFAKSGFESQIICHTGSALEIIPTLNATFDLVFIDADKTQYNAYFDAVIDKVRCGGCIISDNVLWKGKVLDVGQTDKQTKAIRDYNRKLKNDDRISNVILPSRDGLTISLVV